MAKSKKEQTEQEVVLSKKELKKISKLEPKIVFFEGRNEKEEAQKIRDQIANIWEKARVEQGLVWAACWGCGGERWTST